VPPDLQPSPAANLRARAPDLAGRHDASDQFRAAGAGQHAEPLLRTVGLTRHFRVGGLLGKTLHAVDDVDLEVAEAEIVALVGESGSGKSTVARLLARIYQPTRGEIWFAGRDISKISSRRDILAYRGQVPMVFQDPFSSFNPVHTIGYVMRRGLRLHRPELNRPEREAAAVQALETVGLVPGDAAMAKYPHELSGGQRQRVGFAQAISWRPRLILADEPVSMLDVSIRIGVLNLMLGMREKGISFLYITHDIASARYVADRVVVMYAGHVVEVGPTEDVLHRPVHPYTRLLLSAVPDPRARTEVTLAEVGEPPRVINPGEGCRFRWRCPLAIERCATVTPRLVTTSPAHAAACHVTAPAGEPAPSHPVEPSRS
jgi:peptide/nickel transport system ATP-binding protein